MNTVICHETGVAYNNDLELHVGLLSSSENMTYIILFTPLSIHTFFCLSWQDHSFSVFFINVLLSFGSTRNDLCVCVCV